MADSERRSEGVSLLGGGITENATSPRVGISLQVPKINWVFHGFYGHFYQAPPLLTFSGPALVNCGERTGLYALDSLYTANGMKSINSA